jgi:glycosyltransferase involved in cell wall biosynthesis
MTPERGLSAVIITLNEERNLPRCLGSVRWAEEIVVVDSFSTDRTVEIAGTFGARVVQHEYEGSSRAVQRGIDAATREWIFVIDADEEVTPELAQEISTVVERNPDAGFDIPRKAYAFGRWIEHGGWYPDHQFRLFRKGACRVDHQEVHGGFAPTGARERLHGLLLHHTYETIYSYVQKMNDYTSLQVTNKLRANPGLVVGRPKLLLSPLSHFLTMFISRGGYRDGFHGFVLALLDATYTFLLYAKIWEYRWREREGRGVLPPVTNAALNRLKRAR